jgi:hypothetical protein
MKVTDEVREEAAKRNIELLEGMTAEAVRRYNTQPRNRSVAAALHLTC